ncbi:LysE family translocator [Alloalcanivorax marinus]|uniref:LysE family translocator n=2 Tax=Alloalcanivorax TaxID=3020832 RepID=UPI00193214FA|nr:LysE family translocator [Alloalcanivorax marinus]MBL7250058.1 LysE family translocator [Alloalcanivorax marinus]
MPAEQFVALIGFVAVMTGTPGPNNLMLMASGANAGFRRSLPHILGIAFGCQVMLLCVALGLGSLLSRFPEAVTALRIGGALYLLYLAWRLARTRHLKQDHRDARPLTFAQAALFQWVNPKAWMMILTGMATFTQPAHFTASVTLVAGAFLIIGLPLISAWNLFGAALKSRLHQGHRLAVFNRAMALLLVASLYPTFGIQPGHADEREQTSPAPAPEPGRPP